MAVPLQGSTAPSPFGIPASMWGGLLDKGSRSHRPKKGQAIRTPSSFGSIGSPRESLTPTEIPATPRTPRPGEEVATSSQTSSSAHTSRNGPRADKDCEGSRYRTSSADAVLIKAGLPSGDEGDYDRNHHLA